MFTFNSGKIYSTYANALAISGINQSTTSFDNSSRYSIIVKRSANNATGMEL
jgi:hypothetical protein